MFDDEEIKTEKNNENKERDKNIDVIYATGTVEDPEKSGEIEKTEEFREANRAEERFLEKKKNNENKNKRKSSPKRSSYFITALVGAIIGGLLVLFIGGQYLKSDNFKDSMGMAPINIDATEDINVVAAVAKKGMPSVVGITTTEIQQYLFSFREVEGLGSGVIVDSDGYILTNSHVIGDGNAKNIKVLLEDGEKIDGKVLWSNKSLDLAVLKVDKKGLPVADLGNSDELQVGEIAVAIGNPLGLEFQRSVTGGFISGLNRTVKGDGIMMDNLIQTDASINPGNSGGPLLNSKGEVIGINTVKVKSGEGLGFSIPINEAKEIVKEVIEKGDYSKASLGIKVMDVEQYETILGVDLGLDGGVVVLEVNPDTPASNANLALGDIIMKVDDRPIRNKEELIDVLDKYRDGDSAEFEIIRSGELIDVEVKFIKSK